MRLIRSVMFLLLSATAAVPIYAAKGPVVVLNVNGVINPIVSDYIKDGFEEATERKASLVVIELDTPGGLLDTTRTIVTSIINAEIPVVVYVTPRGSRATSAGVFITMASDVAAMTPETHIGAAHPVTIDGSSPTPGKDRDAKPKTGDAMSEKMVSDAAAYIRTLASERGRNAVWAEQAVRESVSLTAEEALKQKVIDVVAPTRDELLKAIAGKKITKNGKPLVIDITDAPVELFGMSQIRQWLQMLGHPNVAYILMTIGIYGLIYELATPGIGLGGAVGAICLLLAFFSLQILPINTVALLFVVLGFVLLLIELMAPTHGLMAFAGIASFVLGSFFLIDVKHTPLYGRISLELIGSTAVATALFFGVVLRKTWQARRARPKTGVESLIGQNGVAQTALNTDGMVFINGELWRAQADAPVEEGASVRVMKIDGNKLFVQRI